MKNADARLIAKFLIFELDRFSSFLEDHSIDPTEADTMIDNFIKSNEVRLMSDEEFDQWYRRWIGR